MRTKNRSLSGFTLVEVLMTLFVFSLVMTAAAGIFASTFSNYRATRNVQRNLENVQFVLSIMAKELRTSTIVDPNGSSGNVTDIQFYDHSQGRCLRYRIQGGRLEQASASASDVSACNSMSLGSFQASTTGTVTGSFAVVPSQASPKRVGKATITLHIQEGSSHAADIQTSVSLRDYGADGSAL